jgi:hypothetical protein
MATRRHLRMICPSNGSETRMYSSACTSTACTWWKNGGCSAKVSVVEEYAAHLDTFSLPAECPKASVCVWHQDGPCPVRRLGMLCEHVPGGEWNTWQMAPANEWDPPAQQMSA